MHIIKIIPLEVPLLKRLNYIPIYKALVYAIHVRTVRVCSDSMNDVIDNTKNNSGDPLDAMYIACARSVSENVGLLLKNHT